MKILLFGGKGFIGEYLALMLQARGDCDVIVVDRDSQTTAQDFDVDVVVVLTQPWDSVKNMLLPALVSTETLKKIIYCSSLLVYPDALYAQLEETLPRPLTEYEIGKYQEELVLSHFGQQKHIALCIARLANVYGDVKNRGIVNHIIRAALQKTSFTVFGDKDKKIRDYILVDDVARFLSFLVFWPQDKAVEIFNVSTGTGCSVKNLIDAVEVAAGTKIFYDTGGEVLEKQSVIGANSKLLALSGLATPRSLSEGLSKTFERYREFYDC